VRIMARLLIAQSVLSDQLKPDDDATPGTPALSTDEGDGDGNVPRLH